MKEYKNMIQKIIKQSNEENREFQLHEIKEIFQEKAEIIANSLKEAQVLYLEDDKPKIDSSKIGGYPYFPKDKEYPRDSNKLPMVLLAQINFEEIEPIKDFPENGILQFFITGEDDLMGMDFDEPTKQKDFRVIYHEKVENPITDFEFLEQALDKIEKDECLYAPFERGYEKKITFERNFESVNLYCYEFEELFKEDYWDFFEEKLDEDTLDELIDCIYSGSGHKIGGYPYFTQQDPRVDLEYDTLLFQLDSEDDIMWGDLGIANFFIKRKDLINKDFSNVWYNWDCS